MNTPAFLKDPQKYFVEGYKQFCAFGGPCVYFHRACLEEGRRQFLSERHIELLYATLTAWGMHRMGDAEKTKAKLTDWEVFYDSLSTQVKALQPFRRLTLMHLTEKEYSEAVSSLQLCYRKLRLSISGATIVANSKALYHLLPDLIPPIDRQYTIRFFNHLPDKWRGGNGRFRVVTLPSGHDAQFSLFQSICVRVKRLADRVDPALLEAELRQHEVTAPKAIDNAIVSFVRLTAGNQTANY